jgi:hypothetical protein
MIVFHLGLMAAMLCALSASARPVATDKNPKPDDPDFWPSRTTFDCTARDTLNVFAGFQAAIPDSNTASENLLPDYACRSWNERGGENIYRLDLDTPLTLFAALRAYDDPAALPEEDFDIFLLNECDTDSCLAGENLEFSLVLDPGTYYLVVDGYGTSNPAQGFYTLVIEARELGLPLAICQPGGATPIAPGVEVLTETDNLFGQPNLMQDHDCSPIVERGGELWYAVNLEPYHEFSVEIVSLAESLDGAIWLFAGCGPEALCLDFADDELSGESESLGFANDTETPVTVYVGIDSYRPPEESALGEVSVQFTGVSNVSTTKQTLGGVRSLFR